MAFAARASAWLALGIAALTGPALAAAPAPVPSAAAAVAPAFPLVAVLCYHDVSDDSAAPLQTVSPAFLRAQIRACKAEGWAFLSLRELLARRDHPGSLPPRVIVLTFDDGYQSFLGAALPVLRAEGVPSTVAPITSFVEAPHADMPPLLTWAQLRELDGAPDVEIASHSHALHDYEVSNPYRDTAPAVATRRYLPAEKRYENREEYRGRIGDDMVATQRTLRERLGHPAAVLVWPYGMHNEMASALAARAGFAATLALGARLVTAEDLRSGCLPRIMVTRRMEFGAGRSAWYAPPPLPVRAAQVDLDALWDPDDAVFRARLDQAVTRVRALGATHVILPACPDPRGDGRLLRAYAMNHQLPVLADVWSMAAAKFAAARVRVWVRAPAMNLTWAWERHPEWRLRGGERDVATHWGTRISPELPGARAAAVDFFTDLAVYLPIDGVLFDDDAMMRRGERLAGEVPAGTEERTGAIRGLIEACKQAVRAWRPECRFARVLPAGVVLRAGVDPGTAQDFSECLAHDDLTIVVPDSPRGGVPAWSARDVRHLAQRALARWDATARVSDAAVAPPVLLLLPAYDLRAERWLGAGAQQALATAALGEGLVHLGTCPVAAEGELPIGLLDDRTRAATVPDTQRRH